MGLKTLKSNQQVTYSNGRIWNRWKFERTFLEERALIQLGLRGQKKDPKRLCCRRHEAQDDLLARVKQN